MGLVPVEVDHCDLIAGDAPHLTLTCGDMSWTVPGAVLEGLWRLGQDHLAATTEDIPYEDSLHLCLLTPDGHVAEEIVVGAAYTTGVFKPLGHAGSTLSFTFFDTAPWHLTIEAAPLRRIPYWDDMKGTRRRPFSFRSRLTLRE